MMKIDQKEFKLFLEGLSDVHRRARVVLVGLKTQISEIPKSTVEDSRSELKAQLFAEALRSFGKARLAVTGASMLPSIWPGDTLEVRRENASQIVPGDVVLFRRDGRFVAHRVIRRGTGVPPVRGGHGQDGHATSGGRATRLITRGDRMRDPDSPVAPEELLGRVTAIQRGHRLLMPRRKAWSRAASWLLTRSDLATRLLLHVARASCP
jgi:hypothetical protein